MRPRGVGGLRRASSAATTSSGELRTAYERGRGRRRAASGDDPGRRRGGQDAARARAWGWLGAQSPAAAPAHRPVPLVRAGDHLLAAGRGAARSISGSSRAIRRRPCCAAARRPRYPGLTLGLDAGRKTCTRSWRASGCTTRGSTSSGELVARAARGRADRGPALGRGASCAICSNTLVAQASGPLLLLATARPELLERRPGVGRRRRHRDLRLERFRRQTPGGCSASSSAPSSPPSLRDSSSNAPRATRSSSRSCSRPSSTAACSRAGTARWSFGELPPDFAVPDSVQAVLAARIDLLPAAEKAALQAASVIGRVFWTGPVYELVERRSPTSACSRSGTSSAAAPAPRCAGEREYVDQARADPRGRVREPAKAKRAQLHADFAAGSSEAARGRDEHAPMLAHHYAEAVRPEDVDLAWAGRRRARAAPRAGASSGHGARPSWPSARYEIDEGIALLHRALELEPDRAGRRSSGSRSATRARSSSTARPSGRRWRKRSRSAVPPGPACRACVPVRPAVRDVEAGTGNGAHRRVDRPGPRARRRGLCKQGAGALRTVLLERRRARRACAACDRRAARGSPASLARSGGPRECGVGSRRPRSGVRVDGSAARLAARALGPTIARERYSTPSSST